MRMGLLSAGLSGSFKSVILPSNSRRRRRSFAFMVAFFRRSSEIWVSPRSVAKTTAPRMSDLS